MPLFGLRASRRQDLALTAKSSACPKNGYPRHDRRAAAALLPACLAWISPRHVHQVDDLVDRHRPPGNASQRLSVLLLPATVGAWRALAFVSRAAFTMPSPATRHPAMGDGTAEPLENRGTHMQLHDTATDHVQVRTALLLAAGLGSRLAPLTDAVPKCLVAVSGVPILERLVRALDAHGFRRLVIVT